MRGVTLRSCRRTSLEIDHACNDKKRTSGETLFRGVVQNQRESPTMKKLLMLTAAGGILLALAGPTLAAQRVHRGVDAYASGAVVTNRSGSYYYGPRDAQGRAIGDVPSLE